MLIDQARGRHFAAALNGSTSTTISALRIVQAAFDPSRAASGRRTGRPDPPRVSDVAAIALGRSPLPLLFDGPPPAVPPADFTGGTGEWARRFLCVRRSLAALRGFHGAESRMH